MRYVTKMTLDRLVAHRYEPAIEYGEVTPLSVVRAVRALDGKEHTLLSLEGDGEQCPKLMIGGGVDRFVVAYTGGGGQSVWWSVVDPDKGDAHVVLMVGGQEGEYPSNLLVDLDTVEEIALHFLESGDMYAGVQWGCQ